MKLSKRAKDIFTFVIMALIGLIVIGLIEANRAEPATPADIDRLSTYIYENSKERSQVDVRYGLDIYSAQLTAKVKLLPEHNDFWWQWDEHCVFIWWAEMADGSPAFLRFGLTVKRYKGSSSPSFVNVTTWFLLDYDHNGQVDYWNRNFNVELLDGEHLNPDYPDDFRTKNWSIPDKEIAQAYFDEVMTFWLKQIKN